MFCCFGSKKSVVKEKNKTRLRKDYEPKSIKIINEEGK